MMSLPGTPPAAQAQALRAMAGDRAQGLLFGRPVPLFALDLGRRDLA